MKTTIRAKEINAAYRKLNKDIYFNKSKREHLKNDFLRLQAEGMKIIDSVGGRNDLKSGKEYILAEMFLDLGTKFLAEIKKAEKAAPYINVTGRFTLYKKGKNYIYHLQPVILGKLRNRFLIIEGGKLGKNYRKFKLIKKKIPMDGFNFIEKGKYRLKQTDIDNFKFTIFSPVKKIYAGVLLKTTLFIYLGKVKEV